jgi:hypothetical protein
VGHRRSERSEGAAGGAKVMRQLSRGDSLRKGCPRLSQSAIPLRHLGAPAATGDRRCVRKTRRRAVRSGKPVAADAQRTRNGERAQWCSSAPRF